MDHIEVSLDQGRDANLFHSLANTVSVAIFIVQDLKIQYANPTAAELTGFSMEELLHKDVWEIAHSTYTYVLEKYEEIKNSGASPSEQVAARFPIPIITRDGQERWLEISASQIELKHRPAWMITAHEITRPHQAEQNPALARNELGGQPPELTSELLQINRQLLTDIQSQPAAVWVADASGRILEKNAMADALWGGDIPPPASISEFRQYKAWWPDTGQELQPEDWALIRAVTKGEVSLGEVIDIQRFDGSRATILSSAGPIYNEEGHIVGGVAVSQDITHQREIERLAQAAAFTAQQRLEQINAIFAAMSDAVITYDSQGVPILANPAAVAACGFDPVGVSRPELLEKLRVYFPDGRLLSPAELPVLRALRGEQVKGERLVFTNPHGHQFIILASASPLYSGETLFGAVLVWHDVTVRERLLSQLQVERSRLRTIIENAPEAVMVADQEGRILLANPAAEHLLSRPLLLGQPYENLSGLEICYLDGTPYDPRNLPLIRSALDGETHTNVELLIRWSDRQRYILSSSAPIRDQQDNLSGAVAILQDITQRKQAEEQFHRSAEWTRLVASLSQAFAEAGLDYPAVLETIVQQIAGAISDICILYLASSDHEWLEPVAFHYPDPDAQLGGDGPNRLQVSQGLAGQVFHDGQPVLIPFLPASDMQDLMASDLWPWLENIRLYSLLIVPLRAQGRLIGVLSVIRCKPYDPFTVDDQSFLQSLANRAAQAIENARLYAVQEQRARELDALHTATSALLSTLDLEDLLIRIMDAAISAISPAERGVLHLVAQDTGQLQVRAARGYSDSRIRRFSPAGHNFIARAVRTRTPSLICDLLADPEHQSEEALAHPVDRHQDPARSAIVAPLILGEQALGALSLVSSNQGAFSETDLSLLMNFAATTTMAIQNATLHAEVQRQAITDSLTGLYNRRGFFELGRREVERAHRFERPLSAIMLDIDLFKRINDTYTHAVGDQVLKELAHRLGNHLREVDVLGRYGGEEFSILLPETDLFTACGVAERLRVAIEGEPILASCGPLSITISLGVSKALPLSDLESLLHQSDLALLAAKSAGRNRVEVA